MNLNDKLYSRMDARIIVPGWYVVSGHGNPWFMEAPDHSRLYADKLAARIKADPNYKGKPILLASCNTALSEILGIHGSSLPRKVLSILSGVKTIAVTLSTVAIPLDELKSVVMTCMQSGGYFDEDADDAELQRIAEAVDSAPDAKALFRIFNLGRPEDALDVL